MPYGYVFGAGSECVFTFLTRVVSLICYWMTNTPPKLMDVHIVKKVFVCCVITHACSLLNI